MPDKNSERTKKVINALKKKVSYLRFFVYVFVVTSFLLTSLILFWINSPKEDVLEAYYSTPNNAPEASLYLSPKQGAFKAGEEFYIDVFINTGGHSVVAAAAYLSFSAEAMKVISIDTSDSVFNMEAEKQINGDEGKIKLTLGKPTPGVKSHSGLMAKIRFKALKQTEPRFENIYFDFARNSSLFSTVILDDKKGTNILTAVRGTRIIID